MLGGCLKPLGKLGCLAIFTFGVAVAAIAFYVGAIEPRTEGARAWKSAADAFGEVVKLEADVENAEPFDAPADGQLSDAQLARFVSVQERLDTEGEAAKARVLDRAAAVRAALQSDASTSVATAQLAEELAAAMGALKATQVAAMNGAGFSVDEYRWVQRATLAALGVSVMPTDLRGIAGGGDPSDALGRVREGGETNAYNEALAAPYAEQRADWATLAVLGF